MALTIAQYETAASRRANLTGETPDGHTWYTRHYHVPEPHTSIIPSAGDAFPGLTAGTPAHLGPYVRSMRYGPRQVGPRDGLALLVTLQGRTLALRDAGGAAAVEIRGRKPRKTATHYIYDTIWVGANLTDTMPKRGDTLTDPDFTHTNDALCTEVTFDETSEPGRVLAFARFQVSILREEDYS